MDETDDRAAAVPAASPRERERAAAYLDLWERHVAWLALHGRPGAPAPRRRSDAPADGG